MASGSKNTCKHAIAINILVSIAISSEMLVNYLFVSLEMPSGSIEIDKITLPAVKAKFNSTFVMSMMCVSTSSSSSTEDCVRSRQKRYRLREVI